MAEAVGMLEVFGLATAFAAADAGCKAGNVWLENFDKNKPGNADELPVPLIVMIKFRGSVSDVQAALEAAKAKAEQLAGVFTADLPSSMLSRTCFTTASTLAEFISMFVSSYLYFLTKLSAFH